jgi:Tol biopolymer transport system component
MTPIDRFERALPTALTDLADPRTPDYFTDILGLTARTRQRPAWASLERWLPMADTISRSTSVPRLPWRSLGVALILLALLIALVAVFVGSRQHRLPEPFGPAANGLVAYANGGDIYTVDPATGVASAVVTGSELDARPTFSLDGSKLAFLRQAAGPRVDLFDVFVAGSDGTDARVVSTDPVPPDAVIMWTPKADSLLVAADGRLVRYGVTDAPQRQVIAENVLVRSGELRPPDAAQILYEPDATPGVDLWIMDIDGSNARPLLPASALTGSQYDLQIVRWSPDGTMIAFTCGAEAAPTTSHVCLVNADGSGRRWLTDESPQVFESDFVWSPDSRSIAFNRWATGGLQAPQACGDGGGIFPIGVASVADGTVRDVGAPPVCDGALFDWSPDGTTILSLPPRLFGSTDPTAAPARPVAIDLVTGTSVELPWEVTSDITWQRVAP